MLSKSLSLLTIALVPAVLFAQEPVSQRVAQQDPVARLYDILPEHVAADVAGIVRTAIDRGLPGLAIADRALELSAKGRSGEDVLAAARSLAGDLAAARGALERGGRSPDGSEIESGALAMHHGVDGVAVSGLASSAPSGRSLAVPLAVIGALVYRGLPSDDALYAVQQRLKARASDTELLDMPGETARMLGEGLRPNEVGLALASARAGFGVPVSLPIDPPGPPPGVPLTGGDGLPGPRPGPPIKPPVP